MIPPEPVPRLTIGTCLPDIQYHERSAVRVIVVHPEKNNKIAVLYSARDNYFKLPGGSIEGGETHAAACEREVLKEIGCHVTVAFECIAVAEEYSYYMHQMSYCYVATVTEETGKTDLSEEEKNEGLGFQWHGVLEVLRYMFHSQPTSDLGRSIRMRDMRLLWKYAENLGLRVDAEPF